MTVTEPWPIDFSVFAMLWAILSMSLSSSEFQLLATYFSSSVGLCLSSSFGGAAVGDEDSGSTAFYSDRD